MERYSQSIAALQTAIRAIEETIENSEREVPGLTEALADLRAEYETRLEGAVLRIAPSHVTDALETLQALRSATDQAHPEDFGDGATGKRRRLVWLTGLIVQLGAEADKARK